MLVDKKAAKEILNLYRPGSADEADVDFAEALEFAKNDPELLRWFQEHCAVHQAIRSRFEDIVVPAGLKEQILSERQARTLMGFQRRPALLAICAATILLLIGLGVFYTRPHDDNSLAAFRARMAGTVLRGYPKMDLETNDLAAIQQCLAQNGGHGDYVLPEGLGATTATGCKTLPWHSKRVSMVCFNSGKNAVATTPDLFLFIIDRSALSNPPATSSAQFTSVSAMTTASWTSGNKTYVLGGLGDEKFLRKFL
jgi:hypothetical protein